MKTLSSSTNKVTLFNLVVLAAVVISLFAATSLTALADHEPGHERSETRFSPSYYLDDPSVIAATGNPAVATEKRFSPSYYLHDTELIYGSD